MKRNYLLIIGLFIGFTLSLMGNTHAFGKESTPTINTNHINNIYRQFIKSDSILQSLVVVRVSAHNGHTCAVTTSGAIMCWGNNDYGQLGDGTTLGHTTPQVVSGLSSGAKDVSVGFRHSCALLNEGGVKCWGWNNYGQLGDGTTTDRFTPVNVNGLSLGVKSISAGDQHSCAVLESGGISCWGRNGWGQLGNGTTTNSMIPVDVIGLSQSAVAVESGAEHTCAVVVGGGLFCWGYNGNGQLGNGTENIYSTIPIVVLGFESGGLAVSSGNNHTCGITSSGGVKCWGSNYYGQIGDGSDYPGYSVSPKQVVGLVSGVIQLSSKGDHSCAIISTGSIKCWGNFGYGEIPSSYSNTPQDVITLSNGIVSIASGYGHSCVILENGGVKCWGKNEYGQLGDGTTSYSSTPMDVIELFSDIAAIDLGYSHTCALTSIGGVKCWGENMSGQLGNGTNNSYSVPKDVINISGTIRMISAGRSNTCALTTANDVYCWGYNIGNIPIKVNGLSEPLNQISAGAGHVCILTSSGGVKCWGNNNYGQLGDGTTNPSSVPVDVVGLSSGVTQISAGPMFNCALTSSGGIKCWGKNSSGQLGNGTFTDSLTPTDVVGLTSGMIGISSGDMHACGLTQSGGVKCWGYNRYGQLGNGYTTDKSTPVNVVGLTSGVKTIALGGEHSCSLLLNGGLICWGSNNHGELGDGSGVNKLTPVFVLGLTSGISAVSGGGNHTCALPSGGGVKCWGYNGYGEIGYRHLWVPVDVVGFGSTLSTFNASGSIKNTDGTPLPGVTISNGTISTITNAFGEYTLSELEPGTHTLTPEKRGYVFTPNTLQIEITDANLVNQDFLFTNPQWTLMYYLDGDNKDGESSYADQPFYMLNHLELGLIDKTSINVLAIVDRKITSEVKYYWVKPDSNPTSYGDYSREVDEWVKEELNMGDPNTLADFMGWAMDNFPANYYGLIMYDHGSGLGGAMVDDTSHDKLELSEIKNAFSRITAYKGKIDVLVMQACLMGLVEVGYQFRDNALYYVASENITWNANSSQEIALKQLTPETTPEEAAIIFLNSYDTAMKEWNNELIKWKKDPVDYTFSVVNLTKADEMKSAIGNFGVELEYELANNSSEIQNIRENLVMEFPEHYIDLYDFAQLVKERIYNANVILTAEVVMNTIMNSYLVDNRISTHNSNMDSAHGVSIHFPDIRTSYYTEGNYDFATGANWGLSGESLINTSINQTADWGSFLVEYFSVTDPSGPDDSTPPDPIPLGRIREFYTYLPITIR